MEQRWWFITFEDFNSNNSKYNTFLFRNNVTIDLLKESYFFDTNHYNQVGVSKETYDNIMKKIESSPLSTLSNSKFIIDASGTAIARDEISAFYTHTENKNWSTVALKGNGNKVIFEATPQEIIKELS